MFVTVIATLCHLGACEPKLVTNQATQMECRGPFAQQALSKWMADEGWLAKGYTLQSWSCVAGTKERAA